MNVPLNFKIQKETKYKTVQHNHLILPFLSLLFPPASGSLSIGRSWTKGRI